MGQAKSIYFRDIESLKKAELKVDKLEISFSLYIETLLKKDLK